MTSFFSLEKRLVGEQVIIFRRLRRITIYSQLLFGGQRVFGCMLTPFIWEACEAVAVTRRTRSFRSALAGDKWKLVGWTSLEQVT